ncbi:MAG: phospholipid carrier-dependent glycosyltransferase [Chloroflexi bacterium]|nr:MAG: phospholipid carrier-dependent glycosyltransferase [Chloroflexota bacterium]
MPPSRPFPLHKLLLPLALILIFGLGLALRLFDLSNPPLDFHPTRQLFAAIKARGLYYQTLTNVPDWQKDLAVRQWEGEATIEPPLMENLAAWLYRFTGEQVWIPRTFSVVFWMLGGLFLFLLARNLTQSQPAAVAALAFYLFLPYGMTASRAFQPDPLMVMLLIISWWALETWGRRPTWGWTLVAGISGGLAIFVKFPAAFFVLGGAAGVVFAHIPSIPDGRGAGVRALGGQLLEILKRPQTWGLALLGVLPSALYLYYGLFVARFLGQQFNARFFPEMWLDPYFYLRWFIKADLVVSALWLALALFGWLVFPGRQTRIFLAALWGGYFVFGLAFAHHISSHDYYSLPLIPIAALSFTPLAAELSVFLRDKVRDSRLLQFLAVFVLLFALGTLSVKQYLAYRAVDYRPQAAFWAGVGDALGHQPGVLALTSDYGYPLAYYGWQNSSLWPQAGEAGAFRATFIDLARNKSYFLITDFDEFDRQPELQEYIRAHYPVLAQGKGYLIYDLLHRLKKAP